MGKHEETARAILKEIGGAKNITHFTHCATRLRFTLKDATNINTDKVSAINGVLAGVPQGEAAYQVVIGPAVEEMFQEINSLPEMQEGNNNTAESEQVKGKTADEIKAEHRSKVRGGHKALDAFFEYLSDSFRPIIGVLLAASLVIALINVLKFFGVITADTESAPILFLNAISQSVFYFLPIFIAYNASKKLKVDPWVGAVIMAALMTPQFLAIGQPNTYAFVFGEDLDGLQTVLNSITTTMNPALGDSGEIITVDFMGLPLIFNTYSGNVFVPLLMCALLGLLYKGLKKIIPDNLHLVFVPFLAIFIMTPLTAFLIGPIGIMAGNWLGIGFSWMASNAPFVFAIIIPLAYPFLVPLGLHWPLNALMLMNISQLGYDFIQGPMAAFDFACYGATCGVLIITTKEKNSTLSSVAAGALVAGLTGGISEPSLYGIHLRYKRIYPLMLAGCLAGGLFFAVMGQFFPSSQGVHGITANAFAFTSIFTIPVFDPMWLYCLGILVSFFVPTVLVVMFDYRSAEERRVEQAAAIAQRMGMVEMENFLSGELVRIDKNFLNKIKSRNKQTALKAEVNLQAPVDGEIIELKNVSDSVFAAGLVGNGLGINPTSNIICSPADGTICVTAKTKHAIGINGPNGVNIVVHVGADTTNMQGEGFELKVAEGDKIKAGDVLLEADIKKIKDSGYDPVVMITVSNTAKMRSVKPVDTKVVSTGDKIIEVSFK